MNIAYFAYRVEGTYESPTSVLHPYINIGPNRVIMFDGFHYPKIFQKFDWAFTIHENLNDLRNAWDVSNKRYVHLEWLMPWRINHSCYGNKNWGYPETPEDLAEFYKKQYEEFAYYFNNADKRSISSNAFIPYMREITGCTREIGIKYPSVDTHLCKFALASNARKERTITTVSRFVPHKKIKLMAQALAKWNQRCNWILMGWGEEINDAKRILDGTKVTILDLGAQWGYKKLQFMSNSLGLNGWGGIPPGEFLCMGSYCLCLNDPYNTENYGDNIAYYEDDPDDLADKINYYWNNEKECIEKSALGKDAILSGSNNVGTYEKEASFVLSNMEEENVS